MSRSLDFDPFIHPPLKAEQRDRLRAEGLMGPAEEDLSFEQVIDSVNPLHHLPVVGTIYRAITGDTLSSSASVVGSMIYGGPLGMVGGLANAVVEEVSGSNVGDLALAMLTGEKVSGTVDMAAETAAAATAAAGTVTKGAAGAAAAATTAAAQRAAEAAGQSAKLAERAAAQGGQASAGLAPPAAATPQSSGTGGQVLEGAEALAALAADLRAAVAGSETAHPSFESSTAEAAQTMAGQNQTAASNIPPPESFMPLKPRDFGGPTVASQIRPEHSQRSDKAAASHGALFPAGPNMAAGRVATGDDTAERADKRNAAGRISTGIQSDQRFAGGIAPRSNFTDRMMEALNKYQALDSTGSDAGVAN